MKTVTPSGAGKVASLSASILLTCLALPLPAIACDNGQLACFYQDGKFAPFGVDFSTEASVAGLDVNISVSQTLSWQERGEHWNFQTKITGFVYGLYGSITDTSDFSTLPDNSYQMLNYSRKANLYGVIPLKKTSFYQQFQWRENGLGEVKSRYKDNWYEYDIEPGTLDQGLILLQLRADLLSQGPDIGTKTYIATSKKHIDDDFMFRFVKQADLQTPLGKVATVVYELLKGEHKQNSSAAASTRQLGAIENLVDTLISLRQEDSEIREAVDAQATENALNELLRVDTSNIVLIDEADARASQGKVLTVKGGDSSIVKQASEIEENNARVFIWFSRNHAYLPVKLLAVIDSKTWVRLMVSQVSIDGTAIAALRETN